MLDLYKTILPIINPILTCYSDNYPVDKEAQDGHKIYPYCTIRFPNTIPNNEYSNNISLVIDVWSNVNGVQEVEIYADSIYNALNNQKIMTENMFIQIYRDNPCRTRMDDEDINIKRRQIRFYLKVYED
jgi:hypothetical protein